MNPHLQNSEKKLIRIFLLSAFIFLVIFEGIFLGSRYFSEKENAEKEFIQTTNVLSEQPIRAFRKEIPHYFGIDTIRTASDGKTILSSQIQNLSIESISEILDETTLSALSITEKGIVCKDGYMIRKFSDPNFVLYYFTKQRDDIGILRRDIYRFLIIDFLLLIPIFFLIRAYIRKIFCPIQENVDTMTHFVHDAGHELKTPLAIISGNLQIMQDSRKIEYDLIDESIETIDTMNESIQGLLELADLKTPHSDKKTDLKLLIEQEIKRAKNPKNISIYNHVTKPYAIEVSEKHLSILVRNLIENAIKYNKDNGDVFISLHKNTLIIRDSGIGMGNEDMKRIFDRFYRIHRNSSINGSGIGLTLVDKITKLYNWKITVESEEGIGTTFSISFK